MFLKQTILSDAVENTEGLKIVYDDVAPYAKENSTPQVIDPGLHPHTGLRPRKGLYPRATTVRQDYPDLKRDDLTYPGYAFCYPGFALLNGDFVNFPDDPDEYGYVSDEVSDDNGNFKYTIFEEGLRPRIGLHPSEFLYPKATTPIKSVSKQPPNTKKIVRYSANSDGSGMTETKQSDSQYVGIGYMPTEVYEHENLLSNSDFKNGITGWNITNNSIISIDSDVPSVGLPEQNAKIIKNTNSTSPTKRGHAVQYVFLDPGTYTLSSYVYADQYYTGAVSIEKYRTPIAGGYLESRVSSTNIRGQWIRISLTVTLSIYDRYMFACAGGTRTDTNPYPLYGYHPKLERGDVVTDWTPTPSEWLSDTSNYQWIPIQEYGQYIDSPSITVTFNQKFTSVGVLLTFNTMSGDYANNINIKWFSEGELLSSMDFSPDSTKYFCSNYVTYYDKIIITFLSTSKPNRPVFLTRIDYGIYREFLSDEIREISCLQEINAISENISINTMNTTVSAKANIPFDLQKKQKLSLYFNGGLIGCFYLKNGSRKSKTDYYMDSHDALGVLDGNEYHGGIYTGQLVPDVIAEIFSGEDFNYLLADDFDNVPLYGYIPYTTKRNALVQIAFAIGAVVDTSNYDGVVIYPKQTITSGEFTSADIFGGLTLEHSDVVTGVRLTVHDYQQSNETAEIYSGVLNGTAEIVFQEPYHDLTITGGTIGTHGNNYAYITGTGGTVTLTGKKYSHYMTTISKDNPNIIYNKNIKEVQDATLVYSGNASTVLDRVYEYYQRAENVNCDVILGNKVIGQVVDIDTDYDGVKTGTIEKVMYSFAGSIKAEVTIHE